VCVAVGSASNLRLKSLILQNTTIKWVNEFKYLGVYFKAAKSLSCDITPSIKKFYSTCNSILNRTKYNNELTRFQLCESKCLPFLTYSLPGLNIKRDQLQELNKAWNIIVRKIFGFNMWESVKLFIGGLGKLNFKYLRLKLIVKFLKCDLNSNNEPLKYLTARYILKDFKYVCDSCGFACNHIKEFDLVW